MNWITVTGHYEAKRKDGTQLRIDPLWVNDWPAFRWSAYRSVGSQPFHHEGVAVDLESAKRLAENFTARDLAERHED